MNIQEWIEAGKPLNVILHGDCMDVMKDIPDKYFELAIVDPPYRDPENNSPTKIMRKKGGMKNWVKKPDKKYFDELFRISENQIICGGNYFTEFLVSNNNWIIWYKNNAGVNYSMCELLWTSVKKCTQLYQLRPMGLLYGIHPTEKPIKLYQWLLINYAKPGDKIIDTHSGSGSCAIACNLEKHDFLAIEKDYDYWEASVKRYESEIAQGKLF